MLDRGGIGESRDVAARPREAGDQSSTDWIGHVHHDDRDGRRRLLDRDDLWVTCDDDVELDPNHFGGEIGRKTILKDGVPALDLAEVAESALERLDDVDESFPRPATEIADPPRLLD